MRRSHYWLILVAAVTPCGLATSSQDVNRLLERYVEAEQRQDYRAAYSLFTGEWRDELRRESGVHDARAYVRLRQSSEARWFDFKESNRVNRSATQVDVIYEVTIEESGERERAKVTVALLKTNGKWRIARIDY